MTEDKKLDPMEGWKWWQEAWYDTQGARVEFFVVALILAVVALILGRFPLLRGLGSHAAIPFIQLAAFEFAKNFRKNLSKDFAVLLNPVKDQVLLKKLLPLSIAGLVFGLGYISCNWLADISLSFGMLRFVLGALENAAFLFAVPLVTEKGMEPFNALKESLSIVLHNAPAFLVYYGIAILSVLAGLCSLGIGFLFLFPLYVYMPYLIYTKFESGGSK